MHCFGDISKYNNRFDTSLKTTITRFEKLGSNRVIISESINLVAIYETIDGFVPIDSHSFTHLNQLLFPVIVNNNENIIALQEPNLLTEWSLDFKERISKNTFTSKIIALISFNDQIENQPIVVFENGFCQSLSKAIETRKEDKESIIISDEVIQSVDGILDNQNNKNIFIYLITKCVKSDESRSFGPIKSVYKLTLERETDEILKIESKTFVNMMKQWTLCHQLSSILAVKQSNNKLSVWALNGSSEQLLFSLESTSIKSMISMGTINGRICLIGKSFDNYLIELWDTKFGTKLGEMIIPDEPLVNDSKVVGDKLFIACYKGVYSIPIRAHSICLSKMIGKVRNKPNIELNPDNDINKFCADFESADDQSLEDIYNRFSQLCVSDKTLINEDIILQLLNICSSKMIKYYENSSLNSMFSLLISLPFNEVFIISKIKTSSISFEQILLILKSLSELLPTKNNPTIDWMCILIDAYMTNFIMNPNKSTIELIVQISDKIEFYSQFYEELGEIKNLFDLMIAKKNMKDVNVGQLPKPKRGQYCIELLKI